ncbi:MAG: DNA-directed RNA polymerase subunit delta [Thermaerobacter sp.]|nr:DNA-directed RNA polymerase subunit delta [Thermaerobacter sp.]
MDQTYGVREPLDVASELLRQSATPMMARALLEETLKLLGKDPKDTALLAELQTEISLDNRFIPASHGTWGLREWAPKPKPTRAGKVALEKKAKAASDDDDAGEASEEWD